MKKASRIAIGFLAAAGMAASMTAVAQEYPV